MTHETIYSQTIIKGLMDTDAYKLHMLQAIVHNYPTAQAVFEFKCRSDEDLRPYKQQVIDAIEQAGEMAFEPSELRYLASLDYISDDFVSFLKNFRLNPENVVVSVENGQLMIRSYGSWAEAMMWEIPILAIVSEIRNRNRFPAVDIETIRRDTYDKIRDLKAMAGDDLEGIEFVDFGTRRRVSQKAQAEVIDILKHELPNQFKGTSNYHIAKEKGIPAVGTQAHEWFQAHQALGTRLADSQKAALETWANEYRGKLAVALTDCITTKSFLDKFDLYLAKLYDGLRQDSGDPIEWGEQVIAHYEKLGIDPKTKTLVFSDSLNFEKMVEIYKAFKGRAKMMFGIGTFLTGTFSEIPSLNIVFKMVQCNGQPVVKISDDPGKLTSYDDRYLDLLRYSFELDEDFKPIHKVTSSPAQQVA